jgi:histidinol-phosphatase
MPSPTSADLSLALALADLADEITLGRFRATDLAVETKPDATPVTEADRAVETALRARLADDRPGDAILGEEYGASDGLAGARRWIVDPIDGTKNYLRGVPVWATLLALEEHGEVTLGVVSAPALHRRWWAERGGGAFLDDGLPGAPRPIHVSGVRALEDAHFSFGGLEDWTETGWRDALLALGARCWRTRGFGDLWSYMLVAEGGAEIGIDPTVSLWDLAAPKIIVEEAGGRFTDFSGAARADGGSGVATNGLLHDAVLELVRR